MFRPAFPFPRLGRRPNRTLAHRIARAPTGGTGVNPGQGLVKMPQRRAQPGATNHPPGGGTRRGEGGTGAGQVFLVVFWGFYLHPTVASGGPPRPSRRGEELVGSRLDLERSFAVAYFISILGDSRLLPATCCRSLSQQRLRSNGGFFA